MRIYVPATASDLAVAAGLSPRRAHAVTPALRAAAPAESEEDLEVAAFLDAADTSLARLARDDVPTRVVVAAEIDEAAAVGGEVLSEIEAPAVPWSAVVSIHVDDPDDGESAEALRNAVGGDEAAVDAATDLDLLWYDVTEREELVRLLAR